MEEISIEALEFIKSKDVLEFIKDGIEHQYGTQKAFAGVAGIDKNYLCQIIQGKHKLSPKLMRKLLSPFGLTIEVNYTIVEKEEVAEGVVA